MGDGVYSVTIRADTWTRAADLWLGGAADHAGDVVYAWRRGWDPNGGEVIQCGMVIEV